MCGILGIIGYCDKQIFSKALYNLSHRGPDGMGIWQNDNVCFGHRRLAIIDIGDSGKQPMEYLDRYVITYNGEIYNYIELRIELEKLGYVFKTKSDTEVLLASYDKWGAKCLLKFNGMWAFAIWDKKEKKLFLSRDRIGKKPLFYTHNKDQFIFASEMKGLYPFFDSLEYNYSLINIALQNQFHYETTEQCLIKNILRFPAGHFGILENGKLYIEKYWNPLEQLIEVPKKYEDQVQYFRELFLDACKLRMRSDVSIATALSGGIDSSAVICSIAHIDKTNNTNTFSHDWQHAFIACFPGTSIDETVYAKMVTNHLGIKSNFINIEPELELDDIFYQTYQFEEIYYAPTIPFVQLYRKMSQSKIKVSIDGHGADELFAGYPFDMDLALIDAFPNFKKFKEVADATANVLPLLKPDYYNKLKYAFVNNFKAISIFAKNTPLFYRKKPLDYLNSHLLSSTYTSILPTLLRNYDRYSMMNGIEIRMPFLDYRILQFAFSIPYSSKIRNGFSKAIVRDAMKGIVPNEILQRKKKIGFNSPMHDWMQGKMKDWILDQINSKDFDNCNLINPVKVKKDIIAILEKKHPIYDEAEYTFSQLIPFIWDKAFKKYATSTKI